MWTPSEVRRLIAQLAGVALAVGGFVLLVQGATATGRISITSAVLSGQVESGSAGLFLLLLGVFLIALPIFWQSPGTVQPGAQATGPEAPSRKAMASRVRLLLATVAMVLVTLLLLFGGELLSTKYGWGAGALLAFAGVLLGGFTFIMGMVTIFEWVSDSKPESASREPTSHEPPGK